MTPRHPSAGAPALHATDGATTDGTCGVIGANRTFDGTSEGSVGLVGTLFFSDYLGMTSQVIRSYGTHDEGAWTYFFRPSYDSQTGHFHVRYTHVGENVRENMNRVGFIRDDDRREVDSNVRKQFWINRSGLQDLTGSINYNQFWSQSGRLAKLADPQPGRPQLPEAVDSGRVQRGGVQGRRTRALREGLPELPLSSQADLRHPNRHLHFGLLRPRRQLRQRSRPVRGRRGLDDHRRPHRDLRPQAGLVRPRPHDGAVGSTSSERPTT